MKIIQHPVSNYLSVLIRLNKTFWAVPGGNKIRFQFMVSATVTGLSVSIFLFMLHKKDFHYNPYRI